MTIIEQIEYDYPEKSQELAESSQKFIHFLANKKWWQGGWRRVTRGEGGANSLLTNMMLRVIEYDFDYEIAFADYSRQLFKLYGTTRKFNEALSFAETFENGTTVLEWIEGIQADEWKDPTGSSALDYAPSAAAGRQLPDGPSPDGIIALTWGGTYTRPGGDTYVGSPPPHASIVERLARLTDREREMLDLFGRTSSYQEVADILGIGRETVKSTIKTARQKVKAALPPMDAKTSGSYGMHRRWHLNRGIVKDDCRFCQEDAQ